MKQDKKQADNRAVKKEDFMKFVKALASVKPNDKLNGKGHNPTKEEFKQMFIYKPK